MNVLSLLLLGAMALTGLFFVLSTSTNYWLKGGQGNSGLWRGCYQSFCVTFTPNGPKANDIRATRAFMILSVLVQGCAFVLNLLRIFVQMSKDLFIPTLFAAILANVCALVGLAIFTAMIEDIGTGSLDSYGWSFYIGWGGLVLGVLVVVPIAVLDRKPQEQG